MSPIVTGLLYVAAGAAVGAGVGYAFQSKLEFISGPTAGALLGGFVAGAIGAGVAAASPAHREAGVTAAVVGVGGPIALAGYNRLRG